MVEEIKTIPLRVKIDGVAIMEITKKSFELKIKPQFLDLTKMTLKELQSYNHKHKLKCLP